MKTLLKILALAFIAWLGTSCEKDERDISFPAEVQEAISFETEFTVTDVTDPPQEVMKERFPKRPHEGPVEKFPEPPPERPPECWRTWTGSGESELMGDVTVKISVYCIPAKNKFCNLTGTFKAEDGSELFFSIAEGQMECNKGPNCDYFDYTFNDVAVINGGTGRFSDAFGSFHPNALVHNAKGREWNALFSCKGNIHLVPPSKPSPGDLINEP